MTETIEFVQLVGILPVELNAEPIAEEKELQTEDTVSQLLEFVWSSAAQVDNSHIHMKTAEKAVGDDKADKTPKDIRPMIIDPLNNTGGKVPNKPVKSDGTVETSFYSSGGGWDSYEYAYYDNLQNLLDVFGTNIIQDGIVTVIITGQQLDSHWNFEPIDVSFDEFYYIDHGGANDEGGGTSGPPVTNCGVIGDGISLVDWAKIRQLEGFRLDGYVPIDDSGNVIDKSGVTVASGFDIGQRNLADLQKLGFSQGLIDKLKPYLGKIGQAALDYEKSRPLFITQAEAETINRASHAATLASLVSAYDNATHTPGAFYELPAEAQTVLASVSFQYGSLAIKTPNFWNQVVTKDWSAALANLWSFGDKYTTRRHAEHDLLKKAVDEGRLHNGSLC